MKKLIFLIVLISLNFTLLAQNRKILTPDGKLHSINNEVMRVKQVNKGNYRVKEFNSPNSIYGPIDTLEYPGPWDTNFGFFGQDWMLQWFRAPTNLILKKVGFACFENLYNMDVEVKVVKVNWVVDELLNAEVLRRGYYEALGNGYNDITSFFDNPDRTGGWTSIQTGDAEPFGNDIWSFDGTGFQITPVGNTVEPTYQWVDLSILEEPFILQGEIFAIAIKHTGTDMDQNRIGFWAKSDIPPGWKFYANGRLDPGVDYGWWTREFTFNFAAEVEIFETPHPRIIGFTQIPSGIDTGPFTIDAIIMFVTGFGSATIWWTNDGGIIWNDEEMKGVGPNFTGVIPAQSPNTTVEYYIEAIDLNGSTVESMHVLFHIFGSSGVNTLVVFNGFYRVTGYPEEYYFGSGDWPNSFETLIFDHDVWAYGPLIPDVVNNYTNIIELCSYSPADINNDTIRAWLEGDANRNYLLAGDEWLGVQSGWTNEPHIFGEFHFDILGINYEYNDVNYAVSGDQQLPSEVFPQAGALLGGPISNLYDQVSSDSGWTAPMMYDPWYEIGVDNWMDGVDFEADVEVDLKGLGADGVTYNIAGHRTLPAGNKIAFFGYDPLSLNSDSETGEQYWWYGFMDVAPQVEVLKWFGVPVSVEQQVSSFIPDRFSLSQNYPNPFNPITKIKFEIPGQARNDNMLVTLKVYDVLGNEIATLVNEEKPAESYEVEWDASRLPSGVYFYQLSAGNLSAGSGQSFVKTKKMVLLR